MNEWMMVIGLLLAAALFAWCAKSVLKNTHRLIASNIAGGTHEGSLTKRADAVFGDRHLLVKIGTDANHIALCGAADLPLGTCPDEPEAIEDPAAVHLLGVMARTQTMVASEVIAAGARVFTAANGKVQDLPAVAGTYYEVGTAMEASGADGDEIEVQPCHPRKVVIGAALTLGNANGEIAALTFTALGATGAECEALRDKCEEVGDDVRAIYAALQAAGVLL